MIDSHKDNRCITTIVIMIFQIDTLGYQDKLGPLNELRNDYNRGNKPIWMLNRSGVDTHDWEYIRSQAIPFFLPVGDSRRLASQIRGDLVIKQEWLKPLRSRLPRNS
jgi:hypothetical protein